MIRSESIKEISTALSKAQAEITHADKSKVNPHFKSKYADLSSIWDACRGPLTKNGLSIVQTVVFQEEWILETTMMHTSGELITSQTPILASKQDAQGFGSGMTYARRYALAAMVGVSQDDDDGNAAIKTGTTSRKINTEPHTAAADDLGKKVISGGRFKGTRIEDIGFEEAKKYYEDLKKIEDPHHDVLKLVKDLESFYLS